MNQENRKAGKIEPPEVSWILGFQIESLSSFPAFLIRNRI